MIQNLMTLLENNKFLVAGLGVSGFGLISFWFKDVPLKILNFIKRQITTDLTVQNYDEVNMKPQIKFNKKYSIEFDKIYAIEVKPWGKIWVWYRENKQNKAVIYKGKVDQLYSMLNQIRVLRGLPPLSSEK